MKFLLIGVENEVYQEIIGEPFLNHYTERVIATFDSSEAANDYIEKSRLKQRQHVPYHSDIVFKSDSLLRDYERAWVKEEGLLDTIPHNPEIS